MPKKSIKFFSEDDIKKQKSLVNYETFDWNKFFDLLGDNKHCYLLGITGSGKTNFLINLINRTEKRFIFFNSIGHLEVEKECDLVIDKIGLLKQTFEDKNKMRKIKKICYTPRDKVISNEEILQREWNYLVGLCYMFEDYDYTEMMEKKGKRKNLDFKRRSNLLLINDETMYVTENENIMPMHRGLMTRGRNYRCMFLGATQRNQNIPKIITSQSRIKIIFELDIADIKYLTGRVAHVEKALLLDEFHFIVTHKNQFNFYKPVDLMLSE